MPASSRSSSSSSSSDYSRSSSGASVRKSEHYLPKSKAVDAMVYFTGRNPKKVKRVKVIETTYPEFDDEGSISGWSMYSWSGRKRRDVEVYFIESTRAYWDYDERPTVQYIKPEIRQTVHTAGRPMTMPRPMPRAMSQAVPQGAPGNDWNEDIDDSDDSESTDGEDVAHIPGPRVPPPMFPAGAMAGGMAGGMGPGGMRLGGMGPPAMGSAGMGPAGMAGGRPPPGAMPQFAQGVPRPQFPGGGIPPAMPGGYMRSPVTGPAPGTIPYHRSPPPPGAMRPAMAGVRPQ